MRQIYEYHPVIGFRFIPETKVRMPHEGGGYLIRTNETGFRSDRPFDAAKKPGKKRVLLFGDSFTAGEGVSNGQRYSDYLEKLLPGCEFFNFGLPATGLDQHYLIYKEFAQNIDHDLLVIAVFVENVRRVGSRYRYFHNEAGENVLYAKPYYTLEGQALQLHGVPPPKLPVDPAELSEDQRSHIFVTERFPRLKKRYNQLKNHPKFDSLFVRSGLKDQFLKLTGYQPVKEYDDPDHPAWQVMRALIRQWIAGHPKPVLLMPIPLHHYVYGLASAKPYQARLREATESAGGRFIDPLEGLMARPLGERKALYYPNDGHLTKAGNEVLAQVLAPSFSQVLSIPLAT
ncbi:MAG: SGNH/GDSL hydrolase family protein [Rubrivivax sp.]|nr:SGNH/GDSL hydrolase family protein [Rubrivivax sp.]